MGYGGFVVVLSFLMLLTHGLAARGYCRGDAFTTSSIGLVLGLIILFVFFPVSKILLSALQDNDGAFAPGEFFVKFIDRSVWGLDCVTSNAALRRRLEYAVARRPRRLRHDGARPRLRADRHAHGLHRQGRCCAA